jgi:DNA-directed RNA polymerase specialized sigma24 family protein
VTCCDKSPAPPRASATPTPKYEHAICHARGLGLSHREIAAAAQVSHGTVRAILTRATTTMHHGHRAEPQSPEREAGELAA